MQYFSEMGTSIPLQAGFDRYNSGRPGYNLTAPFGQAPTFVAPIPSQPEQIQKVDLPPPPTMIGMGTQPQYLVTSTPVESPTVKEKPVTEKPTKDKFVEPPAEAVSEGECNYPGGLCAPDMNVALFKILTSRPMEIACACDPWEYYGMSNPSEGSLTWTWDQSFIYRDDVDSEWITTNDFQLKYSRWGPKTSSNPDKKPIRILFLHDALDSRKSWWCCQKLLSPFFDTVSIDLLGSGESTKPRGLGGADAGNDTGDPFPWSFELHAKYLNDVSKIIWPKENIYVVGLGWGAQIAASMSTTAENISGIIMVNPVGFSPEAHPEYVYSDISNLAKLVTDEELSKSPVSFVGCIQNCLMLSMNHPKEHTRESSSPVRFILAQYSSLDRQRVLIDQIKALASLQYQEFPTTDENPNGLQVDAITIPTLIISGSHDIVYPPEHRNLYPAVYYNSSVETVLLRGCGHLIQIEEPKALAELILDFIREKEGFGALKDAFIGFLGSSQGNERSVVAGLKSLYKM